ncbi:MAG: DUF5793 family protein [Haloferacaceae archaeon]
MRRDYFELTVDHVDWVETGDDPEQPTVRIDFHGPEGLLRDRLTGSEGEQLSAEETDVSCRLQETDPEADEETGVVAVTNRVTGEFVLELNEAADDVLRFIQAAREYGRHADDGDGRYRVQVAVEGDPLTTYEKRTFLVYDAEGNLMRSESLIPSGVEL